MPIENLTPKDKDLMTGRWQEFEGISTSSKIFIHFLGKYVKLPPSRPRMAVFSEDQQLSLAMPVSAD